MKIKPQSTWAEPSEPTLIKTNDEDILAIPKALKSAKPFKSAYVLFRSVLQDPFLTLPL